MLFENKTCPQCGKIYDKTLEFCPNCRQENDERVGYIRNDKVTWLPAVYQILIFFVGSFGLGFFQLIITGIVNNFTFKEAIEEKAIIIFVSYFLLFLTMVLVLIPNYKYLFKNFKSWKPYVWGAIAGLIIITYSILYPMFINLFYEIKDSGNQSIAVLLTRKYPLPAFLVLGFIGPILEELTYRLGLFTACKRINRIVAYVVVALVFGLIHFDFQSIGKSTFVNELINLPIYVGTGLFLAFIYEKFSLAASITAHMINNIYSVSAILILQAMGK